MTIPQKSFRTGFIEALPFLVVIVPFGLLFGVVATEAGLDLFQTMVMTAFVLAGASQFAVLQLLSDQAPALVAILTGLAINLRLAMYSASMSAHIGKASMRQRLLFSYVLFDQTYAIAHRKFEETPALSIDQKIWYFIGSATPLCLAWIAVALVGALAGSAIPAEYALDFAIPVTFIALFAPLLRSLPQVAAAFVSIVAALVFVGLPYNLGLMVAAILAMMTGAALEKYLGAAA